MKARTMLDSAALDPSDIAIARAAFDAAWDAIANRYATPATVEEARTRLATLILSLVPDTKDPGEIQAIAVQEMTKGD